MPKSIFLSENHYFEAIIQLRPYNEKVYTFIEDEIKKHKGIFISKLVEHKTGIDLYLSSQKFARNLGQKMKRKFRKGKLVMSRTLHTQDRLSSRLLYRATILFRLPEEEDKTEEE